MTNDNVRTVYVYILIGLGVWRGAVPRHDATRLCVFVAYS